jgi:hypothetical protein
MQSKCLLPIIYRNWKSELFSLIPQYFPLSSKNKNGRIERMRVRRKEEARKDRKEGWKG